MSVLSGQSVTADFTTCNPTTGAAQDGDVLPTGALVVNGVDSAAVITITNKGTGSYKAAVTLPALAAGDVVQIRIAATVATVAGVGVVWTDTCQVAVPSVVGAVTATGVGTPVALDGGPATLAGMLTKIADDAGGGAFDATTDSLHEIATDIAGAAVFPAGAIEFTYTVTDSTTLLPVDSVDVWISTDAANPPTNVIWRGTTDVFGIARDALARKPWLDPGTYYFWLQDEAYSVVNPDTEVVS